MDCLFPRLFSFDACLVRHLVKYFEIPIAWLIFSRFTSVMLRLCLLTSPMPLSWILRNTRSLAHCFTLWHQWSSTVTTVQWCCTCALSHPQCLYPWLLRPYLATCLLAKSLLKITLLSWMSCASFLLLFSLTRCVISPQFMLHCSE